MAAKQPLAKIGILSIGQMGMGIAELLLSKGFAVATNLEGRSQDTASRCRRAKVEVLLSDAALVSQCSVILSIVPPRDAEATARRVVAALADAVVTAADGDSQTPLYYADLNAVSPATARSIASLFDETATPGRRAVRFVDGGIIGGPPVRRSGPDATHTAGNAGVDDTDWARPSIPTSGPHSLSSISGFGSELSSALNCRHIASHVGGASGLKMCFAATAKGFSAIAIQAFVTAHSLGVEKELRSEMAARLPNHLVSAERGVPGVAPKAYRWVREMEEIAETFAVDGGFGGDGDGEPVASMFRGAAAVFQAVADDPVLGAEKTEHRKHGRTLDEFTETLAEGLQAKKRKRTTEN